MLSYICKRCKLLSYALGDLVSTGGKLQDTMRFHLFVVYLGKPIYSNLQIQRVCTGYCNLVHQTLANHWQIRDYQ